MKLWFAVVAVSLFAGGVAVIAELERADRRRRELVHRRVQFVCTCVECRRWRDLGELNLYPQPAAPLPC